MEVKIVVGTDGRPQIGEGALSTVDLMRADGLRSIIAAQKATEPCNVIAELQSAIDLQNRRR